MIIRTGFVVLSMRSRIIYVIGAGSIALSMAVAAISNSYDTDLVVVGESTTIEKASYLESVGVATPFILEEELKCKVMDIEFQDDVISYYGRYRVPAAPKHRNHKCIKPVNGGRGPPWGFT